MNLVEREQKRKLKRNRRMILIGILFSLMFLVITIRAFYLQTLKEAELSAIARRQYRHEAETKGKRGSIYDRKMRKLAMSIDVTAIGAHPDKIVNPEKAARIVARILNLNESKIRRQMLSGKSFVWISREQPPVRANILKKAGIKGLEFYPSYIRVYPNKTLAGQLIGFTGLNEAAREGIEFYYDDYLKGRKKTWLNVRDASGRVFMRTKINRSLSDGKDIILTIDAVIQNIAEQAIGKAVRRFNARSGMAIVMVPSSGEILAIANYPLFNPNSYKRFPKYVWRNRVVTDPFEPGSTMKVFLAAAALESGKCTPETKVDCENGVYTILDRVIHDTHPHGVLSLFEIVKYSSNIGAAKIARMIGPKQLYDTLYKFGFGQKTEVGLPGETAGKLRNYLAWYPIDTATIAFGQGISVSALQLVTAISAMANGGMLVKPRIIDRILNPDGSVLEKQEPEFVRRVVSSAVAESVRKMMQAVTEPDGTGPRAVPKGYTVCGKTGTAQILNSRGTYEHCDYNALFAGFSPAKNPKLAVVVVITAPQGSHYGGVVAAPAFREILSKSFNYLNVPPDNPSDEGPDKSAGLSSG